MSSIFLKILDMSKSACFVVPMVLLLRFFLKKSPKWTVVLLWSAVAVRLICPFSFESVMSLMPKNETVSQSFLIKETAGYVSNAQETGGENIINTDVADTYAQPNTQEKTDGFRLSADDFTRIWLFGVVTMLIYAAVSGMSLKRKMKTAVLLTDNIFQSENAASPFVLGVIKPRIYLPFDVDSGQIEHIIAHERAHIKRKDHLIKPFAFTLLAIHWFNPLIWLSFILLCRDIELACDEKVIKGLENGQRADYSAALLACSVRNMSMAVCPLSFGEVGVKERVKGVMSYKKPGFWVMALWIVCFAVLLACFLTNPVSQASEPLGHSYRVDSIEYSSLQYDFQYTVENAPMYMFSSDSMMYVGHIDKSLKWDIEDRALKQIRLTKENFDDLFEFDKDGDLYPKIRKNTRRAYGVGSGDNFYYLIKTRDKETYLVWGRKNSARYLFKLAKTDLLSCESVSEGADGYIEPSFFKAEQDINYDSLPTGSINKEGTLIFNAEWDCDSLMVNEKYYRNDDGTVKCEESTYVLSKNKRGSFELSTGIRGDRAEEAVYTINAEKGVYAMKIVYEPYRAVSQDDLEQYRTEYIGDAAKTSGIAQRLPYPKNYAYSSIELKTEKEPYELIVYLKGSNRTSKEDFENCSTAAFNLIENMGVISFYDADSKTKLASFTKDEYEKNMKYYLTVGADGVQTIEFAVGNVSGGCVNADSSPFKKGSSVYLEFMDGRKSLSGLTLNAVNAGGETVWSADILDDGKRVTYFSDGDWYITNVK